MTQVPLLLVVHDPDLSVDETVASLRSFGCNVITHAGLDPEVKIPSHRPELIVAALRTSEPVAELVQQNFAAGPTLPAPILVLCAHPDYVEAYSQALEAGADNFLSFPPAERALHAAVNSLLRRGKYRREVVRDAEARFSQIFENAAVGIAQLTPSGEWLRVNERLCQILGYSREQLLRTTFQEITYPPDLQSDLDLLQRLLSGTIPSYRMEKRYVHRDGHLVWANLSVGLERDDSGKPKYLVSVVEEITDRKTAERERGIAEERLTAALNASATGTFRWAIKDDRLIWDQQLKRIFGYPANYSIRRIEDFTNCLHPEDKERVFTQLDRCRAEGTDFDLEFRIVWPDGSVHWIADRGRMFLHSDGTPDYMTGACLDITARKQEEEERRANAERLRMAFRSAGAGSFDWDIVKNRAEWTPELEALYGLETGTWDGNVASWEPLVHPDDRKYAFGLIDIAFKTGELSGQWRIVRRNGEVRWVSGAGKVFYGANGEPVRMIGINLDITAQKAAEQALRERAQIIDQIPDAIMTCDAQYRITLWSRGAERLFGYTAAEACGQLVTFVHPREVGNTLLEESWTHLSAYGTWDKEYKLRRKSGELFDSHMSIAMVRDERGEIAGAIAYITDVTERKRTEHALRVSEKLAATGRLASTLAHEINNPLASVTNLLFLLEKHSNLDDTARSYVTLAEGELARVTHITRNLLSFQRENRSPQVVDLPSVLDSILELYEPKLRARQIAVERKYLGTAKVKVFPGELKQVLSNLLENALDATADEGRLFLRVKQIHSEGTNGDMRVQISVADTGKGIDPEHLNQIFEPFFTTKGERGTGLGLWVSKDIVAKQGGNIRVRSQRDRGSVFRITLPGEAAASASGSAN